MIASKTMPHFREEHALLLRLTSVQAICKLPPWEGWYHLAYVLADMGLTTLMVDCDSQCNLTAYALTESQIEKAWDPLGNSIYRIIEPVARTLGDIRKRRPTKLRENLWIVPGDLWLSDFEDLLGDTWSAARAGTEPALRSQVAIYRSIQLAAKSSAADIVLIDLGPNLGALNRAVLGGSDYIIVPVAPDLFSIRGTENLGNKLVVWNKEWEQCNKAWKESMKRAGSREPLSIPRGNPRFLGYITQHHNIRNNEAGMTRGWQIFGTRVASAVQKNIVDKLMPLGQVATGIPDFDLGKIPNFHSLIPYAMEARKPVFECTGKDGLTGNHIKNARDSREHFEPIANVIASLT